MSSTKTISEYSSVKSVKGVINVKSSVKSSMKSVKSVKVSVRNVKSSVNGVLKNNF